MDAYMYATQPRQNIEGVHVYYHALTILVGVWWWTEQKKKKNFMENIWAFSFISLLEIFTVNRILWHRSAKTQHKLWFIHAFHSFGAPLIPGRNKVTFIVTGLSPLFQCVCVYIYIYILSSSFDLSCSLFVFVDFLDGFAQEKEKNTMRQHTKNATYIREILHCSFMAYVICPNFQEHLYFALLSFIISSWFNQVVR